MTSLDDFDPEAKLPLQAKRYANRKIYVPENKSYVNLQDLYEEVRSGRDIQVFCLPSQKDVTLQVLGMMYSQLCVEAGKVDRDTLLARIRAEGPA